MVSRVAAAKVVIGHDVRGVGFRRRHGNDGEGAEVELIKLHWQLAIDAAEQ